MAHAVSVKRDTAREYGFRMKRSCVSATRGAKGHLQTVSASQDAADVVLSGLRVPRPDDVVAGAEHTHDRTD